MKHYVYVLFDWCGIPRYIGKGKGNRWNHHERDKWPTNPRKSEFIKQTIQRIGEIPKIKIAENLSEDEAFTRERELITAIGMFPTGPLYNLTLNRSGPSSERMIVWHASRTIEQRSETARKSISVMTPEQLSERNRKNALTVPLEVRSERMRLLQSSRTAEQRKEIAQKGGAASTKKRWLNASDDDRKRQGQILIQARWPKN